jgi:hypothetical protein
MFDWRQLKRWAIAEDRLPPGSIIKFKQLTIWDMYKGRIIGAFAMILLQALIIFYLLHQSPKKICCRPKRNTELLLIIHMTGNTGKILTAHYNIYLHPASASVAIRLRIY